MAFETTAFLVGRRLGGFVLESLVGAGGMAEVYRARDLALDREVAIKVLAPALAAYPLYAERFRDEARKVAALDHPNIVAIYHYGEDDELFYLVMPLLDESLHARINRLGLPPMADAAWIVTQIANALESAHARGIVHCDVKPENILLDVHGKPLLADFGIARALADAQASDVSRGAAASSLPIGTPAYMAPEQLRREPVDARADIYALGAVLYELLAGAPPHAAPTVTEIIAKALTEPPLPLSPWHPDVSPALDAVVLRALAHNPADRFPSARVLAQSLQHALSDREMPLAPPAPRTSLRTGPLSRGAFVTPATAPSGAPLRPGASGAPDGRRRPRLTVAVAALAAVLMVVVGGGILWLGASTAPTATNPLAQSQQGSAEASSATVPGSPAPTGASGTQVASTSGSAGKAKGSPTPSLSPAPTSTGPPVAPQITIAPASWTLARDGLLLSECTSDPNATGGATMPLAVTNNSAHQVSWAWQSTDPALPSGDFKYQLNGGSYSQNNVMPTDLSLMAGATDWLNVRMRCTGTSYHVSLVATDLVTGTQAMYALTLTVPGAL
ncbi:MAG TPA: protein kinase [Ktedonobacterales bacterium]|nr:protein kinase [Ktedonobacterales bacterium]